ncbi:RWD domain-containing protein 2B [Tachyglossus aculeatus]|uniref:RWD domain-containing protein 2B n=1 Tax=Tachyglossus aculeatus TaxID=9261 RepID=UPI0018F6DD66|nr:RWD domain-containing protein 2B [Tachyglossus aculeatus]
MGSNPDLATCQLGDFGPGPGAVTPTLSETTEAQLSEFELLSSMFPGEAELVVGDPVALAELREFVEKRSPEPPAAALRYTLNVPVEVADGPGVVLAVECILPLRYPAVLPEITVRSPALGRTRQGELNGALSSHLRAGGRGEVCVLRAAEWVREHGAGYAGAEPPAPRPPGPPAPASPAAVFTRLWIYSHHIYSKRKRRDVVDWARELALSGFSVPGRPGLVCAEGPRDACEEFWARLRRLSWKRILIRHREDSPVAADAPESGRRFSSFEEKVFAGGAAGGNHVDLGQLYQFLKTRGCAHVFRLLFGVEGQ